VKFSQNYSVWNLYLTHEEVLRASDLTYLLALGIPSEYAAAVVVAVSVVQAVDAICGDNGVNIAGMGASTIVTPAGIRIDTDLGKIIKAIVEGSLDVVAETIKLPIRILKGTASELGIGSPRGELHADEGSVGDDERFIFTCRPKGKVSLLAYTGFFCADHNRNDEAWADRPVIGPWEEWDLVHNDDNTVSFRSDAKDYLCTDDPDGEKKLYANRPDQPGMPGPWERYQMEWQPDGTVAVKACNGQYVSSAPG